MPHPSNKPTVAMLLPAVFRSPRNATPSRTSNLYFARLTNNMATSSLRVTLKSHSVAIHGQTLEANRGW